MKRRDEVLVGVFLTAALAIGLLGTIWLIKGGLSSGYPLYSKFEWGQNLKPGQPVLLAGVNVGTVNNVKLRNDGFLDVFLNISDDIKVPKNSKASVKPIGIFGDAAIALTPTGPSSVSFAPGDTVPVGAGPVDIQAIEDKVDSVAIIVMGMTKTLNTELVANGGLKDIRTTLANAAKASASAAQLSAQLTSIAAEQNRNVSQIMASFKRATSAVDSASIDSTLKNLRRSSESMARIASNLDSTSRRADRLVSGIERGEGNVGKLMKDTLLYADLRGLVTQADSVLKDLKANPKKYINLRIF
jgi:phospholipid/cholesterol/gamma-HCH transport system substrate-binding protein